MKNDIDIYTDSCCNLSKKRLRDLGVKCLDMVYLIDGKQYLGGEDDSRRLMLFFDEMKKGRRFTTSTPVLSDAKKMFEESFASGRSVLYIGFSSGLSSSYDAISSTLVDASLGFDDSDYKSVDTLSASSGEGMLVELACRMRDSGSSIAEIAETIDDEKHRIAHLFTVSDLMFLSRGGRLSKGMATAGTIMNVKPVLHMDEYGKITQIGMAHGRKRAVREFIDRMQKTIVDDGSDIWIAHADCENDALELSRTVEREFGRKTEVHVIDPVIGAHSGPGTLALFYRATRR